MPRLSALILITLLSPWPTHAGDDVTIYRCTDAKGKLTLRDSPCAKGERQETRSMLRPKDAPPRAATPAARAEETPAFETPRVIVVNTPRPLYECITPDNERYTSDSGEGNPRWVPLWTLGYPVVPRRTPYVDGGVSARIDGRFDNGRIRIDAGTPPRPLHRPPVSSGYGYPAGTWIRDQCYALPQSEVCDRLRDRRDTIRRRFFNAQPSERATLNLEERNINARLSNDCGTS